MSLLAQDHSELTVRGRSRGWLGRMLQPTLGKKFMLAFGVLALAGLANWYLVETMLAKTRGTAAVVNLTGSLRWLGQRVVLETGRFVHDGSRDRTPIDAYLDQLDEAVRVLEYGGQVVNVETGRLPATLENELALIGRAAASLRRLVEQALADKAGGRDTRIGMEQAYRAATILLQKADATAERLTQESVRAERQAMDRLALLGLLDLAFLALLWLLVRLRIVLPLRALADTSAAFADGRRGMRSGFRSSDEIGRLATAFDGMAEQIELDFRQMAADAEELRKRELGLRMFSLAIEHSPVSVVISDAEGIIEYVNARFSEMTGYARQEAIGRTPAILKSGRTPDEVYASLWRTLRSGQEWHGELLSRKKNGELFWEDVSIAPLEDAQGRITHFVAVKEDISGRKRNESAIAKLNAELEQRVAERTRQLEESNRQLESFSYSISHDLRAPLRAINGFAHLLEENEGPRLAAESREMLGRLKRNAVRMGELIDGLLELSRVTRKSLALERVDLSAMAGQILGELAGIQPSRPLQANIQEGLLAEGDATLLHAALENLLGNAWKFTAPRDIAEIAFGCREEGGERVFFVRDNGAGFDMKYADKLFGTFQRLHGQQEFEGNGIGLAMVRRIVTLHGGRVWAESRLDEGATFSFTLGAPSVDAQPPRN